MSPPESRRRRPGSSGTRRPGLDEQCAGPAAGAAEAGDAHLWLVIREPALAALVTAEWTRRTEAEYISAAIAQQVTLWLIQVGAPPDLIRDGLHVVEDELRHSELSAAVAASAGGGAVSPVIEPASLVLPSCGDPTESLVSSILRYFCIGETIAVPLFRMLGHRCSVPVARDALDRVLRDEGQHRQFGWDVLDWALLVGGPEVRQGVADQTPVVLNEVLVAYLVGDDLANGSWHPDLTAWGLAPAADYASTVTAAVTREVSPRLAERGVTVGETGRPPAAES